MEVKSIIRELLDRGMSPEDIKKNLIELGVPNADMLIDDAVERMKEVSLEKEKPFEALKLEKEKKAEEISNAVKSSSLNKPESVEGKLDEIIALLTALQDINKKVLETDRQVLLRLKV